MAISDEKGAAPRRLLLVEDEWLIAIDTQETLEAAGYHVVGSAATVQEALELIEQEAIEAALIDLQVGSETGYPVAEALRRRKIPFTFLTGHNRVDLEPAFQNETMLVKPVVEKKLLARLEAMMAASHSE